MLVVPHFIVSYRLVYVETSNSTLAQRRLRPVWLSPESDQSLSCVLNWYLCGYREEEMGSGPPPPPPPLENRKWHWVSLDILVQAPSRSHRTLSHDIRKTVKAKQPAFSLPHKDVCKARRAQSTE